MREGQIPQGFENNDKANDKADSNQGSDALNFASIMAGQGDRQVSNQRAASDRQETTTGDILKTVGQLREKFLDPDTIKSIADPKNMEQWLKSMSEKPLEAQQNTVTNLVKFTQELSKQIEEMTKLLDKPQKN